MWALLLLPIVLLVLYFAQRLLFRRLWDKNLTVQISFDRDYIFCGEEANLVETIVNNKYLPLPVLEVGFDMSRWVVFQDEENSTVSDMTYRRDVFTASVRQRITRTLPGPRQKARLLPHRVHHGHVLRFSDDRKAGGAFSAGNGVLRPARAHFRKPHPHSVQQDHGSARQPSACVRRPRSSLPASAITAAATP